MKNRGERRQPCLELRPTGNKVEQMLPVITMAEGEAYSVYTILIKWIPNPDGDIPDSRANFLNL